MIDLWPLQTWIAAFSQITRTNVATLIVSIISILALIGFKIANWFLRKVKVPVPMYSRREHMWKVKRMKWKIPLPSQLIVVSVGVVRLEGHAQSSKNDKLLVSSWLGPSHF